MLYDSIIQARQNELFNEIQDLDTKIQQLQALRERRMAEYSMLQNINDRGLIAAQPDKKPSRVHIEDAIKRIFDKTGRPMSIGELIEMLEEFGFEWSNYSSAYYRLKSISYLKPTGARGFYNLIR